MSQCPPALFAKLTLNGLMPDEATDRQGNCGIDAFARSLMAQIGSGRAGVGPSASAKNRRDLKKSEDEVALFRRVGVSWLEVNASEVIWPGMTVSKLCSTHFRNTWRKCGRTGNGWTQHLCTRSGEHMA